MNKMNKDSRSDDSAQVAAPLSRSKAFITEQSWGDTHTDKSELHQEGRFSVTEDHLGNVLFHSSRTFVVQTSSFSSFKVLSVVKVTFSSSIIIIIIHDTVTR